jgi:hypothetical protein
VISGSSRLSRPITGFSSIFSRWEREAYSGRAKPVPSDGSGLRSSWWIVSVFCDGPAGAGQARSNVADAGNMTGNSAIPPPRDVNGACRDPCQSLNGSGMVPNSSVKPKMSDSSPIVGLYEAETGRLLVNASFSVSFDDLFFPT